jgi:hypothetical protein
MYQGDFLSPLKKESLEADLDVKYEIINSKMK